MLLCYHVLQRARPLEHAVLCPACAGYHWCMVGSAAALGLLVGQSHLCVPAALLVCVVLSSLGQACAVCLHAAQQAGQGNTQLQLCEPAGAGGGGWRIHTAMCPSSEAGWRPSVASGGVTADLDCDRHPTPTASFICMHAS